MRKWVLVLVGVGAFLALSGCSEELLDQTVLGGAIAYTKAQKALADQYNADYETLNRDYIAGQARCGAASDFSMCKNILELSVLQRSMALSDKYQRDYNLLVQRFYSGRGSASNAPQGAVGLAQAPAGGVPVYQASQCIGAVVNGECHGSILAPGYPPPICHGQMLNGMCTGPMF